MFNESEIDQRLLDHSMCAQYYCTDNKKFIILSFDHLSFHLFALKVVHIKLSKPNLYRQKKFVHNLKILH